jgi:hypothetical protein
MVGLEDESLLREAVAPENLKDVLVLAGASYEALMMVGEGLDELHAAATQRREDLRAAEQRLNAYTGNRSAAERALQRAQQLAPRLEALEAKQRWKLLEKQEYLKLLSEFSDALRGLNDATPTRATRSDLDALSKRLFKQNPPQSPSREDRS